LALLEYDPSSNALYIRLRRGKVAESEPISDNLILDLNHKKEIIGVEVLGPAPNRSVQVFASHKDCFKKRQTYSEVSVTEFLTCRVRRVGSRTACSIVLFLMRL